MTLGLSMITNNAEATIAFLNKYGQYFDKWFITVADKDQEVLSELGRKYTESVYIEPKMQLSYFKWTDDFAAARNYNLKQIDTDYWFWADDDDQIQNPDHLKEVVNFMTQNSVEVVQFKYDYAQNEQGQAISDHWRERVIKRDYEGKWDAPVHETFQGPPAVVEQLDWIVVKHDKNKLDIEGSMKRNERILRKHFEETKDPRDAFYLGMTELAHKNYRESTQFFLQHIQTSGSEEDQYRSWCRIAECEWILQNFDQALYATDEAIKLKPDFPDAYYIKIIIYTNMEQYDKGIEWLKVATSKPIPKTIHMVDPTLYKFRGLAYGAQCYLFGGRVKEAFALYKEVMKNDPSEDIFSKDLQQVFEDAYFDQKAIDYIRWLLPYTKGTDGQPLKLFESLSPRLFADPRLNAERVKYMPTQTWPDKSIVFYCGAGNETWGPDTLDKGMGGSEEAVVYLSRELAKLGWQVTVFNDREGVYYEEYVGQGQWENMVSTNGDSLYGGKYHRITYKPWTLLNPNDQFNVFVAWRNPSFARACNIKAKKLCVDFHDSLMGHQMLAKADLEKNDLFFLKSKFQRDSAATKIPEDKVVIIPNGIVKEQFK